MAEDADQSGVAECRDVLVIGAAGQQHRVRVAGRWHFRFPTILRRLLAFRLIYATDALFDARRWWREWLDRSCNARAAFSTEGD